MIIIIMHVLIHSLVNIIVKQYLKPRLYPNPPLRFMDVHKFTDTERPKISFLSDAFFRYTLSSPPPPDTEYVPDSCNLRLMNGRA